MGWWVPRNRRKELSSGALLAAAGVAVAIAACGDGDGDGDGGGMMQPEEGNQVPTATITAPPDGSTFAEGDAISFQGSASDPEDGILSGAALVWRSDLQGQIGTGTSFSRDDLSVGTHQITLTATDSDGATGQATVGLSVEAPAPPPGNVVDMQIVDNAFVDPQGRQNQNASVTITLGERVRWSYVSGGSTLHTVTSGEGSGGGSGSGVPAGGTPMDSGLLSPGETFEFEPDAVGTWTYFCEVHPGIMFNSTVVVETP